MWCTFAFSPFHVNYLGELHYAAIGALYQLCTCGGLGLLLILCCKIVQAQLD